jgi:hypothetical protein
MIIITTANKTDLRSSVTMAGRGFFPSLECAVIESSFMDNSFLIGRSRGAEMCRA